jgi:hypothetical protein
MNRRSILVVAMFGVLTYVAPVSGAEAEPQANDATRSMSPEDLERARGTIEDLRRLGRGFQTWTADAVRGVEPEVRQRLAEEGRAASRAAGVMPSGVYLWREGPMKKLSSNEVSRMLRPTTEVVYVKNLPTKDRWGNKLEVLGSPKNLFGLEMFAIRSAGPNGVFEGPSYTRGAWEPGAADDDILWVDGVLVRYPVGLDSIP